MRTKKEDKVYVISLGWSAKVAVKKVEDATKLYQLLNEAEQVDTCYFDSSNYAVPDKEREVTMTSMLYLTQEEKQARQEEKDKENS